MTGSNDPITHIDRVEESLREEMNRLGHVEAGVHSLEKYVETGFVGLGKRVDVIESSLATIARGLNDKLDQMYRDMSRKAEPKMGVWASWAGVILGAAVALGTLGIGVPVKKLEEEAVMHRELHLERAYELGRMDSRVEHNDVDIRMLQERITTIENDHRRWETGKP